MNLNSSLLNCCEELWKTSVTYDDTSPLTELQAMDSCEMMLGSSVVPLSFMDLYKGKLEKYYGKSSVWKGKLSLAF